LGPIVFVLVIDPVAEGFVESIARPGGNMTGFAGWDPINLTKHLQLLKEFAPNINRVSYIHNPAVPGITKLVDKVISVAPSFGVRSSRASAFTGVLANNDIAISMDGKGAWRDNVFVERLWRSVKYEECICGPTKASARPALRSAAT
jgi:ABC-type uncharacterized transport system substrate-binding protein